MSRRATAERYAPRLGLVGSVALHAGIIAATFFTFAHRLDITDQSPPVVPVDLVTLADKTNIAPMVKADTQPPTPQETPPPQQPAPTPPPAAELAPQPLAKPVPIPKMAPPAPAPKKEAFDINNIVALLDKHKTASAPPGAKVGAQNVKGFGAQNAMTADLTTLLRSEIYRCWSPPVGAPHAEDMIVSFELYLNPDGSVAQPPQLAADSASAAAGNPYMRAAAEAARRAIYTCAPYKLPADRYSQWRDVTLIFNPRDMLGQ